MEDRLCVQVAVDSVVQELSLNRNREVVDSTPKILLRVLMRNFVWLPKKKMMTPDGFSSGQMQGSIHIDQMNQNCRNLEVEAAVEKDASESAAPLKMKYLPQLDGLRALAVLAVVVFHARTTLLPGGYIGVDVFFVLSGFLITQIISAEIMRSGAFSFKNFYLRRALRLFPALFLVASVWALIYWLVPGIPQAHESPPTTRPILARCFPLGHSASKNISILYGRSCWFLDSSCPSNGAGSLSPCLALCSSIRSSCS